MPPGKQQAQLAKDQSLEALTSEERLAASEIRSKYPDTSISTTGLMDLARLRVGGINLTPKEYNAIYDYDLSEFPLSSLKLARSQDDVLDRDKDTRPDTNIDSDFSPMHWRRHFLLNHALKIFRDQEDLNKISRVVIGARSDRMSTLGRGVFGEVKLGYNLDTHEWVALKTQDISTHIDGSTSNAYTPIFRETNALKRAGMFKGEGCISHQNGQIKHTLVMPYIEGVQLESFLRSAPGLKSWFNAVYSAMEALAAFNDKNMLHNDAHLQNFKVQKDGKVVLLDYGFSTALFSGESFSINPCVRYDGAPESMKEFSKIQASTDSYYFARALNAQWLSTKKRYAKNPEWETLSRSFDKILREMMNQLPEERMTLRMAMSQVQMLINLNESKIIVPKVLKMEECERALPASQGGYYLRDKYSSGTLGQTKNSHVSPEQAAIQKYSMNLKAVNSELIRELENHIKRLMAFFNTIDQQMNTWNCLKLYDLSKQRMAAVLYGRVLVQMRAFYLETEGYMSSSQVSTLAHLAKLIKFSKHYEEMLKRHSLSEFDIARCSATGLSENLCSALLKLKAMQNDLSEGPANVTSSSAIQRKFRP